jgi:hypothetical protein
MTLLASVIMLLCACRSPQGAIAAVLAAIANLKRRTDHADDRHQARARRTVIALMM